MTETKYRKRQNRKENLNLKLFNYLEHDCKVETNKPSTNVSRSVFNTLYTYNNLRYPEEERDKFHLNIARSLAFYVLSTPDHDLSNMMMNFDIYRKYLIDMRMRQFNRFKPSDLTKNDCQLLDKILKAYPADSFIKHFAYLDHDFSIIGDRKDATQYHITYKLMHELAWFAQDHELSSPCHIVIDHGYYYLDDYYHVVPFHSVEYIARSKSRR